MTGTALIVGASGIVGGAAAELMAAEGWQVLGLSRKRVVHRGESQAVTAATAA